MDSLIKKIQREIKKDFILKLLKDTNTEKDYLNEKEFFEEVEKKYRREDVGLILKELHNLGYIILWLPKGENCYCISEKGKIKLDDGGFVGDLLMLLLWPAVIGGIIGSFLTYIFS